MKHIFTLLALLAFSLGSFAQNWLATGTLKKNFTFSAINGKQYDMYNMLVDSGKYVIFDFSATWCGPCFSLHNSHNLDNMHDMYGEGGSTKDEARVFMMEVDYSTTLQDLAGLTSGTQGNWLLGTTHPIANMDATVGCNVQESFVDAGCNGPSIPNVYLICQDKKLYDITGQAWSSASAMKAAADSYCGAALSTNEVIADGFTYSIFPNPTANFLNIKLNLENPSNVEYSIVNNIGQVVLSQQATKLTAGTQQLSINTVDMPNGVYVYSLVVDGKKISSRFVVAH